MERLRYAALYETGKKGEQYFRFAYIEVPDGFIPPPILRLGRPLAELHEFVYAPDQYTMALAFQTSQQNISRWMVNAPPDRKKEK